MKKTTIRPFGHRGRPGNFDPRDGTLIGRSTMVPEAHMFFDHAGGSLESIEATILALEEKFHSVLFALTAPIAAAIKGLRISS